MGRGFHRRQPRDLDAALPHPRPRRLGDEYDHQLRGHLLAVHDGRAVRECAGMNETKGGSSVVTVNVRHESWFERYAWTVFVFLSAVLVLFGATDLPGATSSTAQENAFNELFIGCQSAPVAVMGLRRRQRWAWYAMALWPLWIVAQSVRAAASGKTAEMMTGIFFLVLVLAALALSYRLAFRADIAP